MYNQGQQISGTVNKNKLSDDESFPDLPGTPATFPYFTAGNNMVNSPQVNDQGPLVEVNNQGQQISGTVNKQTNAFI